MNPQQIAKPCAARPGPNPRIAIVVLGMHRSGTSALARVVSLLGAALPNDLMPPAQGNEAGHWEPAKVAALHDEILASVGSQWAAPTGPAEIWFDSPQASAFVVRIKELILSEYGDAAMFVVKDPRLSLLFPLWSRAFAELGVVCKAIVAVRNPMEIAQSICRREALAHPHDFWHVDRGGLMFLRYVLAAERWTRMHERGFVHYDDLLRDWRGAMRRLSAEMNIVWPCGGATAEQEIDRFLSRSHRHHCETDDLAVHGAFWAAWIAPVYATLKGACSGDPIDAARFDRAYLAYDAAGAAFSRHFEAAAHDLARQIDALRHSTSWRITAPLRKIAGGLRGWRNNDRRPAAALSGRVARIGAIGAPRPMWTSLGALCCAVGIVGAALVAQGGFAPSRFVATPIDAVWKTTKIERFGAALWPPVLAQERRRHACLSWRPREVADRAAGLSPSEAPRPFVFGPPFEARSRWGACGLRGSRGAEFLRRI